MDPTVAGVLEGLEAAIAERTDLSDEARADLAGRVAALRGSVQRERQAQGEERHQLAALARRFRVSRTHILRMESTTPATIGRAAEVFDRTVRTLTGLIEAYTTPRAR